MANWLEQWKGLLAGIAGVLLVVLQIINVILSNDIDHTLGLNKAQLLENAEKLQQNSKLQQANREQLAANSQKLLDALSQQSNGYENGVKKLLDAIEAAKPKPTPQ